MEIRKNITFERVNELLSYNPDTGIVKRKIDTFGGKKGNVLAARKGDIVSVYNNTGYLQVCLDGTIYLLHRIVWLMMTGYMTENQIDHINRVRDDNRWCNLREATYQCNAQNQNLRKDNKTGVKGIYKIKDRYSFGVLIQNKNIGRFKDFTEAVCHRYAAEQCLDWLDCDTTSSAYLYLKEQGIVK